MFATSLFNILSQYKVIFVLMKILHLRHHVALMSVIEFYCFIFLGHAGVTCSFFGQEKWKDFPSFPFIFL